MEDIFNQLVEEHLAWARAAAAKPESLEAPPSRLIADADSRLTLVCGAAGSGKTACLRQAARRLMAEGMPPEATLYLDCSDPRLPRRLDGADLGMALEAYFNRTPRARQEPFCLFLDSAGLVANWAGFAQVFLDAYPGRLWAADENASWLTVPGRAALPAPHRVILAGPATRDTLSLLLRRSDPAAPDPLGSALDAFSRYGHAAPQGAIGAAALQRERFSHACARLAERGPAPLPLPLIVRAGSLLMGASGTAPSLSSLQRRLAAEGVSTTRTTLGRVVQALEEAHILMRLPDFRRATVANARSAPLLCAVDGGQAQALGAPGPGTAAHLAGLVAAELRGAKPSQAWYTYGTGVPGAVAFVRGTPETGTIDEIVAVYGRAGRHGVPPRLIDALEALRSAHRLPAATVVTNAPAAHPGTATVPVETVGRWLVDRCGLIA